MTRAISVNSGVFKPPWVPRPIVYLYPYLVREPVAEERRLHGSIRMTDRLTYSEMTRYVGRTRSSKATFGPQPCACISVTSHPFLTPNFPDTGSFVPGINISYRIVYSSALYIYFYISAGFFEFTSSFQPSSIFSAVCSTASPSSKS